MRIFSSSVGDPMLLDSRDRLAALHEQLEAFLVSSEPQFSIEAKVDGDPAPYAEFLPGLRITKTKGPIALRRGPDRWLELSGSCTNLRRYIGHFYFEPGTEADHHHPDNVDLPGYLEPGSLRLIIEADAYWEADRNAVPDA